MITINAPQRLFTISEGKGYSCLGFDVCERRRIAVLKWLGRPVASVAIGSDAQWTSYNLAMADGAIRFAVSGKRCDAELTPAFIGHENERVEVTDSDGSKRRFYIGKSTGWLPCHLELKTRASSGGSAVYLPDDSKVRFLGERRK